MSITEDRALRELSLKVLARHGGPDAGADEIAAAAHRGDDDLARAAAQLIGQAGIDALTSRAVYLAQNTYPWLVNRREPGQPQGPFAQVVACLKGQDPVAATKAAGAVLTTLTTLLVTFIGEPLTTQLLRKAWPDAFSASSSEDHKA